MLHNFIALKAKPSGSDRPLCLASSYYCIYTRAHGDQVKLWDDERGGFWDDALRNSSALRAAYLCRVLEESMVATKTGEAAGVYWDLEAFYDTVDIVILIDQLLATDWPVRQAAVALQVHIAPRTITGVGLVSAVTHQVYTSLIAGCQYSNSVLHALLHELLDSVHRVYPIQRSREFVDDIAQNDRGDASRVRVSLAGAASHLARGFRALKLIYSKKKSIVVASDPKLASQIASDLAREGFPITASRRVRDLGVDATAGRYRTTKVLKSRFDEGKARTKRVGTLARYCRKASKLFSTNLWPASKCYGHWPLAHCPKAGQVHGCSCCGRQAGPLPHHHARPRPSSPLRLRGQHPCRDGKRLACVFGRQPRPPQRDPTQLAPALGSAARANEMAQGHWTHWHRHSHPPRRWMGAFAA